MALEPPPPPPPPPDPELPEAPSAGLRAASPAMPATPLRRPRRPTLASVLDRGVVLSDMAPPVNNSRLNRYSAQISPDANIFVTPGGEACQESLSGIVQC